MAPNASSSERLDKVAVFSRGVWKIPHLKTLVGAREACFRPKDPKAEGVVAVVGWGHKPSALDARRCAQTHRLPYLRLEDGFLRSASANGKGPPLSLVLDDVGIYYDARSPSRLEEWLNQSHDDPLASPELLARAATCRERIVGARLSKYNNAIRKPPAWLAEAAGPVVLVVDQTVGDASVALGSAGAACFREMLDAAVADHPSGTIVVKTHPDVLSGGKRGHLGGTVLPAGVRVLSEPTDPAALLECVDHVYTVSSGLGFEALLRQRSVTCFGSPFYAGWGLTEDRVPVLRRRRKRSLDALVAAALILYPRYVHPVTGRRCEVEQLLEHLAIQRESFEQNRGKHFCFGFSRWKHDYVRAFLDSPEGSVHFCRGVRHAKRLGIDAESRILVWGNRRPRGLDALASELGVPTATMEDGFLRSVGLGSDFTAPASLVTDTRGIYYDATRPSDLETLLETAEFSDAELTRARALRALMVRARISKYNFGPSDGERLSRPRNRRVILVPGQVEDDASILLGSPSLRTNAALLGEVRRLNPEAYVIYKVHPDVVSGNRKGAVPAASKHLYDLCVERASLAECLDVADEVHTITSLVGFEALLRDKRVVTYGRPFYAGWGLTEDREPPPRRARRLSLDALVAGVLLKYPRYYSWANRCFTTVDHVISEIEVNRVVRRHEAPAAAGLLQRSWRRTTTWLEARRSETVPHRDRILEGRRVLLLQGPVGPFFSRLAQELELAGAEVIKVNFNAGDDWFYRGRAAIRYNDPFEAWPGFITKLFDEWRPDTLLLFGDQRPLHRAALDLAADREVTAYVFEEGYVRPDYITMELSGVNANSNLPRTLEPYLQLAQNPPPASERSVQHGFRSLAHYSIVYCLALTLGQERYPHYQHHKDLNAWRMAPLWAKGIARKYWYGYTERAIADQLTKQWQKRYFLVPLQVYHDAQVIHSRFGSNDAFIAEVLTSFAKHADPGDLLVFKHHPLDRAYSDYGELIQQEAQALGVAERVRYVHDLHLPTLLKGAKGTVVLNSTTGCSSLYHGTPVKVLGCAVYDIEGLTYQGELRDFWQHPGGLNRGAFKKYRRGLIEMCQINGCFYSTDLALVIAGKLARPPDVGIGACAGPAQRAAPFKSSPKKS